MNTRDTGLPRKPSGQAQPDKSMNESLITLDNLSIGYNNQPVLAGISLSIARASFTAILGANGSGKSTLLKTLLGLSRRSRAASASRRPGVFGYVPQTIQFDPLYPLTGFDVALMGVYGRVGPGRRVPPGERDFTRECLRATAPTGSRTNDSPNCPAARNNACSSPARWRPNPNVLVLDEPTAGVEPWRRTRCWSSSRRFTRNGS